MAHESEKVQDARLQAESDVRTLVEAEKIRKDSKRMTAVQKSVKAQQAALAKVKIRPKR